MNHSFAFFCVQNTIFGVEERNYFIRKEITYESELNIGLYILSHINPAS